MEFRRCLLIPMVAVLLGVGPTVQNLEVYRAKHRPAQELLRIVEATLGDEGQVVLDSRTATLILSGKPSAVRRALAMLEELDRPLRQLALTYEIRELSELEAFSVQVQWKVSLSSAVIGTLPLTHDGLRVALDGRRDSRRSTSGNMLKILEGGTGLILTGEVFPFVYDPYWGSATLVPVETGFEAKPTVLGSGRVHLELRPFSGRVDEGGGLRYTAAETSIEVSPGETIVFAEVSRKVDESSTGLDGVRRESGSEQQVLLISVEMQQP